MEYDLTKCHMEKTVMFLFSQHISLRKTPAGTDGESLHHVDPEQAFKGLGNYITLIFRKSLSHMFLMGKYSYTLSVLNHF